MEKRGTAGAEVVPSRDGGGRCRKRASARRTVPRKKKKVRATAESGHVLDEFLTIAAHELKTPIVALQLQARLLLSTLSNGKGLDPGVRGTLQRIDQQSRRVMDLTTSLLEVARLANGLVHLHTESLDFAALVRSVVKAMALEAAACGCETRVEAAGPVLVTGDRGALELLVRNLLANAYRYAAGSAVTLALRRQGVWGRLEVRDGGIGIARGDHARIFERFVRVARDGEPGGLGIGLYLVRRVAELHGGSVSVNSRPGKGATFSLDLPSARAPG